MLNFLFPSKRRPKDPTEDRILSLFGFLAVELGFQYRRTDLGNYTDRNGSFCSAAPILPTAFITPAFA